MQLAILCGGLAKRLGDLSKSTPKALMEINNRAFLDIIIEGYRKAGFTKFVLLAGHLAEKLEGYASGDVKIIIENEPLGTGGAIINALPELDDRFWVANGDTYLMADDIRDFIAFSKAKPASIYLTYESTFDKDAPVIDGENITGFRRSENGTGWVNAGLFCLEKGMLARFRNMPMGMAGLGGLPFSRPMGLEKDILSGFAAQGMLYGFQGRGRLYDIGRPERLELFRKALNGEIHGQKAIFIDRDGTLIEHVPYISDPNKVVLRKGIIEKLKAFQKAGYLLMLISNQSGIKKGIITMKQHDAVMERLNSMLKSEGVRLDDVFFCFSTDEDNDPRRKPGPGMIFEAREKYGLDLSQCAMVGDREDVDMAAGQKAGVGRLYLADRFAKDAKP
jgi:D-glycero-D-manno-heptose 1,7-bisphosphate phosphatase